MNRSELLLAGILILMILVGSGYQTLRGGPKSATLILANQQETPFDRQEEESIVENPAVEETLSPKKLPKQQSFLLQFLNRASVTELKQLPGIGDVKAQRILEYRQQHNGFHSIDQVLDVNGIGDKTLQNLEDYFTSFSNNTVSKPPPIQRNRYNPFQTRPQVQNQESVSLNQASREQLMAISGIGPALADSLLKAREQKGKFSSWSEVDAVSGFGPSRIANLKENFSLP